jgi:hypothetical protein
MKADAIWLVGPSILVCLSVGALRSANAVTAQEPASADPPCMAYDQGQTTGPVCSQCSGQPGGNCNCAQQGPCPDAGTRTTCRQQPKIDPAVTNLFNNPVPVSCGTYWSCRPKVGDTCTPADPPSLGMPCIWKQNGTMSEQGQLNNLEEGPCTAPTG